MLARVRLLTSRSGGIGFESMALKEGEEKTNAAKVKSGFEKTTRNWINKGEVMFETYIIVTIDTIARYRVFTQGRYR